jgi:hypothetical protein
MQTRSNINAFFNTCSLIDYTNSQKTLKIMVWQRHCRKLFSGWCLEVSTANKITSVAFTSRKYSPQRAQIGTNVCNWIRRFMSAISGLVGLLALCEVNPLKWDRYFKTFCHTLRIRFIFRIAEFYYHFALSNSNVMDRGSGSCWKSNSQSPLLQSSMPLYYGLLQFSHSVNIQKTSHVTLHVIIWEGYVIKIVLWVLEM